MKSNEQLLKAVQELVSIDSVALVDVSERVPYGAGPAKALDYVMELCRELNIRTVNDDYKIAWAEIGEGEEIVGVLGHLDIVPAGDGWEHSPWGEVSHSRQVRALSDHEPFRRSEDRQTRNGRASQDRI